MAQPVLPTFHPAPQQLASYPPPGALHPAPTGHDPAGGGTAGVWRRGNVLFMALGARLPPRCVKCNAAAALPIKERTLYWHHPALYLLVVVQVLVYAIVAMIVRKKAVVSPGLCAEHLRRRQRWIVAGWLAPVVIVGSSLFLGSRSESPGAAIMVAVTLTLISVGVSIQKAQILVATRIDDRCVQVKGAGEPFLAGFPTA